jgi:hypothetical protein
VACVVEKDDPGKKTKLGLLGFGAVSTVRQKELVAELTVTVIEAVEVDEKPKEMNNSERERQRTMRKQKTHEPHHSILKHLHHSCTN